MIELAKNIEFLLLENDCVIVPDLGGFIAHYQPARYEAAEQRFYPPVRTIGFNPQLVMNDGLLAQLYMQRYHTDFPDATYRIHLAVEALKDALFDEGRVQIPGVGELSFNMRHAYEFHPLAEGTASPSLYGLDAFVMPVLGRKPRPEVFPHPMIEAGQKRQRRFASGRRWAGHLAAAVASVALFFALSTPVENTYVDKGNYASLGTDALFDAIRSQSLIASVLTPSQDQSGNKSTNKDDKSAKKAEKKARKQAKKEEKKAQKEEKKNQNSNQQQTNNQQPNQQQNQQPANNQQQNQQQGQQPANNGQQQPANNNNNQQGQKPANNKQQQAQQPTTGTPASFKNETTNSVASYFLIVASLLTKSDALKEVEALVKKGFTDAQVIESNGKYRVAVSGYDDKATANKKLKELQNNASYKDAWLYNK